ncbi:hypothetical protein [Prevotella sp. P6B1]|uniref:hypothetical protein n=1 Tax=Prevotella sp. P6B1 TaxID=1410613 RepID=UPI0018CC1437|nr:hypothetical protein [Prevotella sp. P6B1]
MTFNDGQIESHMWFDDESQFQGFVFVLGMMISSGANSFGCIIDTSSEVHLDGQIVEEHDYEEKS